MKFFNKKKKVEVSKVSEKVQFKHLPESRTTLAFCAPTSEELLKVTDNLIKGKDELSIEFKLGISKVHPNDQYNKKVGRSISESRLETKKIKLNKVEQYFGYAHYKFIGETTTFVLLLTNGKEVPFLISFFNVSESIYI